MIIFSIALSEQCNLNCTYCNVDKLSQKRISPDLFLEQYYQLRKDKPNERVQVDFYGGEPLLQWDIVQKIIEELKDDDCKFFMPTNGLLLTDDKVDYLNKHNVQVSLSFDGLWQDENRKQHNGQGTTQLYLKKRDVFARLNNLQCHTMIYKDNYDLLENHLYILDNFSINPDLTLVRDVGIWNMESSNHFNNGFTKLVDWYIENVDLEEMPNTVREYLRHFVLYSVKNYSIDYCGAGDTHLSFTENEVLPCNRFQEKEYLEKIPQFRQMIECNTCEVRNYCRKGCLFENIKNNGPIAELCTMYKHIYGEVSRMVKSLNQNSTFRELMVGEINDA